MYDVRRGDIFTCSICGKSNGEDKIFLLCDAKNRTKEHGCHLECLKLSSIPCGEWYCPIVLPSIS